MQALYIFTGLPSAPTYGVYTFTVLLEWDNPISDDGLGVSYYTTTVQTFHSLQTYVQQGNTLYSSTTKHILLILLLQTVKDMDHPFM